MIRYFQKLKAKKGFTLVELLVVIAIIGILAAVLIPLMSSFLRNARISTAETTAKTAHTALDFWIKGEVTKDRFPTAATNGTPVAPAILGTFVLPLTAVTAPANINDHVTNALDSAFPGGTGTFVIYFSYNSIAGVDNEGDFGVCYIPANSNALPASVTAGAAPTGLNSPRFTGVTGGLITGTNDVAGCYPSQ